MSGKVKVKLSSEVKRLLVPVPGSAVLKEQPAPWMDIGNYAAIISKAAGRFLEFALEVASIVMKKTYIHIQCMSKTL